jgi:hypothetical protein
VVIRRIWAILAARTAWRKRSRPTTAAKWPIETLERFRYAVESGSPLKVPPVIDNTRA